VKKCHTCGTAIVEESVSRRDECPGCGSDIRVCLNCTFYDESRANQCFEPQAERVKEKDRSNYCDYFRFKEEGQKKSPREDASRLWKDLFKKP
jgi:predicted RNA-binding Zn-ribbon protein involved in translation (DUF1610 family)